MFNPLKKFIMIFTAFVILMIVAFVCGLLKTPAERIGVKIMHIIVCVVVGAVIFFILTGFELGAARIGAYVGGWYCILCWIFGWKNHVLRFWANSVY